MDYVCGDIVCDMCVRNDRTECPHVPMDDHPKLKRKGLGLVDLLLEDYKRQSGDNNATVHEMLPDDPVDCFVGSNEKVEKVMGEVSLRNQVSEGRSFFHIFHLYDYSRHIFHTKEPKTVVQ